MSLSSAFVTLGPLCRIEGTLPSHAIRMVKAAGAFQHGGEVLCRRNDWERIESALKAAGVTIRVDGAGPAGRASLGLSASGTGKIEGVLPRKIPKTWLSRIQGRSLANITPYALEEARQALLEEKVALEVKPEYRKAVMAMDDMAANIMDALSMPESELPDVKLKKDTLRPYQRRAIAVADAMKGRLYLADEPGVGKTLPSIAYADHRKVERILVVVPGSLKGQWRDEIRAQVDGDIFIAQGRRDERIPASTRWVITNPDILADRFDQFSLFNAQYVICDEGHIYKKLEAARTQALMKLAVKAPLYWPLTGTPVDNLPIDTWVQLHTLQPNWWGIRYDFGLAFCEPERNFWASQKAGRTIFDFKGVTEENRPVLQYRLRHSMLRRSLEEVGIQMPKQTRTRIRVSLSPDAQRDYDAVVVEYKKLIRDAVDGKTKAEAEDALDKLKPERARLAIRMHRISGVGRIHHTVELLESYAAAGERVVVFGYFRETLEQLESALKKAKLKVGLIYGGDQATREPTIQAFKDLKLDVLVSSIAVGGVGLNLQHASHITITHELSNKPIDIPQSEARVLRSGQTKPVQNLYVLGEGTIDERKLNVLFGRMSATKAFLDGQDAGTEDEILRDIEASFFDSEKVL